jgi:hypothetical protein
LWAAGAATSVGPCCWAVVVSGLFYSCKFVCVSLVAKKWVFP